MDLPDKLAIPKAFEEKLTHEDKALLYSTITNFQTILNDNSLYFFPEFTDHGIDHISTVLATAAFLITDESFEKLHSKDILVLILAVIAHDLGMHIYRGGFEKIVSDKNYKIDFNDESSWSDLWNQFFRDASRFNEDELYNIFGSNNISITEPDLNSNNEYSKKLIGEFLRRYHHRLAHEITVIGFPLSGDDKNIEFAVNCDERIIDLIGLTARSHGLNIRETFEYLKDKYNESWRSPFNIKTIYIMVILRIADYLQIQKDRAPKILFTAKKISNPISQLEWIKHISTDFITTNTDDPEKIYVNASPPNSITYLAIKQLIKSIQVELDESWAILGEVYGRIPDLSILGIRYRRISSNLDHLKRFSQTVKYIPQEARFKADSRLLKLLIGPLYGENPRYGIRELLQNSLDAVNELAYINKSKNFDYTPTVNVELAFKDPNSGNKSNLSREDFNNLSVIISDNGIGMDEYVVINYFLKAGASFRDSKLWRKTFIDCGETTIKRTGRFGIGVFAAFLIGDSIEVFTKHYSADHGLYFSAELEANQIELQKKEGSVGTIIKIVLRPDIADLMYKTYKLKKDQGNNSSYALLSEYGYLVSDWLTWYQLTDPNVRYSIPKNLNGIFNVISSRIPNENEVSESWRLFKLKNYSSIHWTFVNSDLLENYYQANQMFCNGIVIPEGYKKKKESFLHYSPVVSVFDKNSKLPLSLNRNYLFNNQLPFEQELNLAIWKDFIARIITLKFIDLNGLFSLQTNKLKYGYEIDITQSIVIHNSEYYTINHPLVLSMLGIDMYSYIWLFDKLNSPIKLNKDFSYICIVEKLSRITQYNSYLDNDFANRFTRLFDDYGQYSPIWRRIYIKTKKINYLLKKKSFNENLKIILLERKHYEVGDWSIINTSSSLKSDYIISNSDLNEFAKFSDLLIQQKFSSPQHLYSVPFIRYFSELFNSDFLIPIDIDERKEKYKNLFDKLSNEIKYYETYH